MLCRPRFSLGRHFFCYAYHMQKKITVQTIVNEPIEKVWDAYTNPKHIVKWNFASPDWKCPRAENDLRVGGKFISRMEAKDGSEGFNFSGTYTEVVPKKRLAYTMEGEDKRKAEINFEEMGNSTAVTVTFDPENINPIEMQRGGWQVILDNFRNYAEYLK
jgi:uncharacterized protein YndB with AHSA1/START domain